MSQESSARVRPRPAGTIHVILNPAAGRGKAERRLRACLPWLERHGGEPRIVPTTKRGEAVALARQAAAEGAGIVAAAGGDGTLHEVVNGLVRDSVEPRPAVVPLPVGTGCDFARNIGMRRQAPSPTAGIVERVVDVGELTCEGREGRVTRCFVNAVNAGATTASALRVNRSAALRALGSAAYVAAGVPELIARPTRRYTLRWATGQDEGEYLAVSVCNGARFGGGLALAPGASFDDGRLHVATVAPTGLFGLLRLLAIGYQPGTTPRPGVSARAVSEVSIDGEGPVEVDGELPGSLPVRIRCLPGALRLLLPAPD